MGDKCSKPDNDSRHEVDMYERKNRKLLGKNRINVLDSEIMEESNEYSFNRRMMNGRSRDKYDLRNNEVDNYDLQFSGYYGRSYSKDKNKNFYEDDFNDGPISNLLKSRSNYKAYSRSQTPRKNKIFGKKEGFRGEPQIGIKSAVISKSKEKKPKTTNIFFEDSDKAIVKKDGETASEKTKKENKKESKKNMKKERDPKLTNFREFLEEDNGFKKREKSPFRTDLYTTKATNKDNGMKNASVIRVTINKDKKNPRPRSPQLYKDESDPNKKNRNERRYSPVPQKKTIDTNTEFYRKSSYKAAYDKQSQNENNGRFDGALSQIEEETPYQLATKDTIKLPNGSKYKGEMQYNVPEGKGEEYFRNGDIYKGEFKKGKRHGFGVFEKRDKFIYEGNLKDNKFEGRGKMIYANGHIFEGLFKKGKEEGTGMLKDIDGKVLKKGLWIDGEFNDF